MPPPLTDTPALPNVPDDIRPTRKADSHSPHASQSAVTPPDMALLHGISVDDLPAWHATDSLPLTAAIAHELRTPMQGLLGTLELLRDTPLTARQRALLRVGSDAADALMRIANDVLDFTRLRTTQPSLLSAPLDLRQLIDDLVTLFDAQPRAPGVTLATEIDPALAPLLMLDSVRLRQILLNLLSNAVKFTDIGRILIRVVVLADGGEPDGKTAADDSSAIRDATPIARQSIAVEVIDTGIGIPAEALAEIWRPFTQVDPHLPRQQEGSGLGLSISRLLASRLGCTLTLESAVRKGTTARLSGTWPRVTDAEAAVKAAAAAVECGGGHGTSVRPGAVPTAGRHALPPYSHGLARTPAHGRTQSRHRRDDFGFAGDRFAGVRFADRRLADPELDHCRLEGSERDVPRLDSSGLDSSGLDGLVPDRLVLDGTTLAGPPSGAPPARPAHILVVDDHPTTRLVLRAQLRALGHRVHVAEHAEAAIGLLRRLRFDLMLTDCKMPDRDGLSLAAAWRRAEVAGALPMRVIGLTAQPLPNHALQKHAAGLDACLIKPLSLESLARLCTLPSSTSRRQHGDPARPADAVPSASIGSIFCAAGAHRPWTRRKAPFDTARMAEVFGSATTLDRVLMSFATATLEDLRKIDRALLEDLPISQCQRPLHRLTGGLQVLGCHALAGLGAALELSLLEPERRRTQRHRRQARPSVEDRRTAVTAPPQPPYSRHPSQPQPSASHLLERRQLTARLRAFGVQAALCLDWVARRTIR